jgi:integrase
LGAFNSAGDIAMALTDIAIRNAKPREREYKLADGRGLYLLVTPSGGRLWRLKYRLHGVEKKLALGRYPDISLGEARKLRDAAREAVGSGNDPGTVRRRERIAAKFAMGVTFGDVASEYIEKAEREGRAPATITKLRWMREWLLSSIGRRPVNQIEAHEILAVLKRQEANGNLETAKRTRAFASRVFRYAVATARAKNDPAALLLGAVAAPKVQHLAAIIDVKRAGELLRAIDNYTGQPATQLALALLPHVFVRPGELRQANWSEFDFDATIWRIPAARMKKRREHVVPLSIQALAILQKASDLTGGEGFVFPALGKHNRPLSENTITAALRRMGFSADEMTAHGFRAMASTLLNESGKWQPDAIERALAHRDADQVRAAYHRGVHWNERVAMAQWWSNYLDVMRKGGDIIRLGSVDAA